MTPRLNVYDSADDLAAAIAGLVADQIRAATRLRLVLAGGTTPFRAYERLAAMELPWGRVSVLFGDERCVGPDHPDSNYRLAADTLLTRAAPLAVHRIPGELGPDAAAALYEPIVAAGPLDLVLLGIGPDGHTASLFPGNVALVATGLVSAVRSAPKPPSDRVTLTLRALRGASRVVMVVSGADKCDALRRAWAGEVPAGLLPAAEWYVSRDALPAAWPRAVA